MLEQLSLSPAPAHREELRHGRNRPNAFQPFHAVIFEADFDVETEADLQSDLLLVSADSLTY